MNKTTLPVSQCEDGKWMRRCLQLASRGWLGAPPNPMVGAVIVCDGQIIGEGFHRHCGEGHAEVNAFASVTREDLLEKSTMYVSLEPCAHYGRTPPCAKLIIQKHIPEVVVGCIDPFAKVQGAGISMLKEAGIKVRVGILEKECQQLNRRFMTVQREGRPYILLKWAQSADGFIDRLRTGGTAERLSTTRSALRIHELRAGCQAILVGHHTAEMDNPQLNVRLVDGPQPLRVVLDRQGSLPKNLHIFDGSQPTLVCGEQSHWPDFCKLDYSQTSVLPQVLQELQRRNIQTLLVEGGRQLHESFLHERLWDECQIEISKQTLGTGITAPILPPQIFTREEQVLGSTFLHAFRQ